MGLRNVFKNRQRTIMILLVISVIVYLAVDIAYRIIELNTEPTPPGQQVASSAPRPEIATEPIESYDIITERNLFRTTDRPIATDLTDPNSLEATALQLDLYGTIAGEDGKGYAIIEERDKKRQRLYKVGDKVSGATIVKIMRNAVVLRLGEKDQVLKKKAIASTPGERQAGAGMAEQQVPPPGPGAAPRARPLSRPPAAGPTGSAADLASLLTQARVIPHVTAGSSGKPDGVVINEIQPGSLFENAGLVNGDVIQEVNGKPVSGVNDLVAMYRDLKPGTSLSVKVTRGGRQVVLNHTVE
ncbi:MAG TPA: type II secretion system protein N [Syntrophales bacterium]|nr:type II secretion system protein N [Syntrophales bacterium]